MGDVFGADEGGLRPQKFPLPSGSALENYLRFEHPHPVKMVLRSVPILSPVLSMKLAVLIFLTISAHGFAAEATKLREALARIAYDAELREFDSATELPSHLQHLRFYFESRRQGFNEAQGLLEAGIDPNSSATGDHTLLSWCAVGGKADAISLLLSYHADPNRAALGDSRRLPLVEAAKQAYLPGNLHAMEVLLAHGADPEAQDGGGRTALMTAAENGAFQGVQLLLSHGANPNTRSLLTYRYTALMFSAWRGTPRSAVALLRGGADPRLLAEGDATAVSIALANRNTETANVIRKHLKTARLK